MIKGRPRSALSLVSTTRSAGNENLCSTVECLKQSLCRLQAVLEMPQMRQFWLKSDTLLEMFRNKGGCRRITLVTSAALSDQLAFFCSPVVSRAGRPLGLAIAIGKGKRKEQRCRP
jgi:hypothetical protein